MNDIMREWNEALCAPKCEHGHLAPVCDLCKKDAEIARLTAERDAAFAMSRCECATDEACAELAKLRQYLDTAQRRASALGDEVAGLREASKSALLVLCALRDTLVCHPNMGKDIDFAIEAARTALAARKGTTPTTPHPSPSPRS